MPQSRGGKQSCVLASGDLGESVGRWKGANGRVGLEMLVKEKLEVEMNLQRRQERVRSSALGEERYRSDKEGF